MNTYVRAARYATDSPTEYRTHPTGRVLHLATFVLDPRGTALLPGTGRWLPLCGGGGRHVDQWAPTGPEYPGWTGHAHWRMCHHCVRALDRLLSDLNAQDDRHDDHRRALGEDVPRAAYVTPGGVLPELPDDAYPPDAIPLPDPERTDTP